MCLPICNTPITTQMLPQHVGQVQTACKEADVFLIVRPSEAETTTLIGKGFATKNMDVHDKSSNWGLTAGMVPKDPRFSKNGNSGNVPVTNVSSLQAQHNMAKTVPLQYKTQWLSLIPSHFKVKAPHYSASASNGKIILSCTCGGTVNDGNNQRWQHYRSDSAKNAGSDFCFLMSPDFKVSWRWAIASKNVGIPPTGIPIYVWAYQISGEWLPCTGDYDVWMLAPRIGTPDADVIHSKEDAYGRSAATDFYTAFLAKLNAACGRAGNKVFHHGAEAQNFSFTQELKNDESMPVICPGSHAPFMVKSEDVPQLIYQMLQWGYVATLNPKWRTGTTLMAEDTGYAMEDNLELTEYGKTVAAQIARQTGTNGVAETIRLGGMDMRNQTGTTATGPEKGSQDALAQVETSAAVAIQRRIRAKLIAKAGAKPKIAGQSFANALNQSRINSEAMLLAEVLRKEVADNKITQAAAIDTLNEKCFGGNNRGMALTIYNKFTWKDRYSKLQIFRKIAQATGRDFKQSATKFPDTLAKPMTVQVAGAGERARLEALRQEGGFGRTSFERHSDGHGHESVMPIDQSRT